jgi:hypothetical protein
MDCFSNSPDGWQVTRDMHLNIFVPFVPFVFFVFFVDGA